MLLFKRVLFDGILDTSIILTSPLDNDLLGQAESVVVEAFVTVVGGTATLNILKDISNDNVHWTNWQTVAAQALGSGGTFVFHDYVPSGQVQTAFVRYEISVSGTTPTAEVKIVATGRAEQRGAVAQPMIRYEV